MEKAENEIKRFIFLAWLDSFLQLRNSVIFPTVFYFVSSFFHCISWSAWFWVFLKSFFSCYNVSLGSRMLTLPLMLPNIKWIMDKFFVCYMLIFIRNREKPSIKSGRNLTMKLSNLKVQILKETCNLLKKWPLNPWWISNKPLWQLEILQKLLLLKVLFT